MTEKVGVLDNYDTFKLNTNTTAPDATWEGVFATGTLTNAKTTKTDAVATSGGLTLQIGD